MATVSEIKSLINDLLGTNTNDFPDSQKIRLLNRGQDKITNLILRNDAKQEWDDENYQNLNEGYLDITNGQYIYNVKEDENFADLLLVSRIYIKDSTNATEFTLLKKDGKFATDAIDTGTPTKYRISGKKIIFDKIFDYDFTDGIFIQFIRKPQAISINDTTKSIGIPSTFHNLLILYVCYDFARAKSLTNKKNDILNEIMEEEKRLGIFVSDQDTTARFIISDVVDEYE